MEVGDPKTILIRLPNWVGDAVMSTPALRALRRRYPNSRVIAVGRSPIGRLLAGAAFFDEFRAFARPSRLVPRIGATWDFTRQLRALAADWFILLPHSFSSALVAFLSRPREIIGYSTLERGFMLTRKVRAPTRRLSRVPEPMTLHYLRLLEAVDVHDRDERMELLIQPEEEQRSDRVLAALGVKDGEPFVAANPGASFGASKLWTVEGFAELIRGLHDRFQLRTLVLCGPGEESIARRIAERAGRGAVDSSSLILPLELLKPVLRRSLLLVTTDTGPRHIAAALSTPQVVLMGPTDPRYSSTNLERTVVLRAEVECSPCHLKICPIDHRCMTRLGPDQVLAALRPLLRERDRLPKVKDHAQAHHP